MTLAPASLPPQVTPSCTAPPDQYGAPTQEEAGGRREEGPGGRKAGSLTPVLRSSVPPLAAESRVVLRPTSEGSVWDIQLVIMAMVLSTTPIFSSGTDIAPQVASCARASLALAPAPRAASGGGHHGGQGRPAASPRPLRPPPPVRLRRPVRPGHRRAAPALGGDQAALPGACYRPALPAAAASLRAPLPRRATGF